MSQSGVAPTLQLPFCIYATVGKKGAGPGKLPCGPAAVGLWCERTVLKSIKKKTHDLYCSRGNGPAV